MKRRFTSVKLLFWLLVAAGLPAQLSLPDVFSHQMVLQRESPVPVWGTAVPNAEVTVALDQTVITASADAGGKWRVSLPAMNAGGPHVLHIASGSESVQIKDIYVGEVWLCAGQSNMEWPLRQSEAGEGEILRADFPKIRLYHLKKRHDTYKTPYTREELVSFTDGEFFEPGGWESCRPETAAGFSAVAYFFGRELYDSLQVPIGLIQAAVGGSPAQSWISEDALAAHPQLAHLVRGKGNWLSSPIIHPWLAERALQNWANRAGDVGGELPGHPFAPAYLYEAAIAPLVPYGIRGVIWYQGESNATHPASYVALQHTLISDWRARFQQGSFPFYYVQLPRIGNRSRWPAFREAQEKSLGLPNTGMVVTLDQGHPTDVHPRQKRVIGRRLAGLALVDIYGRDLPARSPRLKDYDWTPGEHLVTLRFDHVYAGLCVPPGQQPVGFTLQGFKNAGGTEVIIEPHEIFLSDDTISLRYPTDFVPVAVKYGWAPFPENKVVNSGGLPLAPFKITLRGNN